jgi:carbon storage regulator
MLVLTRGKEEAVIIGDRIEVKVLEVRGDKVRLGIVAPPEVQVHRKEVYLAIQKENVEAARAESEGIDEIAGLFRERKTGKPKPSPPSAAPEANP